MKQTSSNTERARVEKLTQRKSDLKALELAKQQEIDNTNNPKLKAVIVEIAPKTHAIKWVTI